MYQCYFEKSLLAEVVTAVATGVEQTMTALVKRCVQLQETIKSSAVSRNFS